MEIWFVTRQCRSMIELEKNEQLPLGISLKDSNKSDGRIFIKELKARSTALQSQCLAEDDVLLVVNSKDIQGMDKKDVKRLLKEEPPCLTLEVQYGIQEVNFSKVGLRNKNRMYMSLNKENSSFGFIIRKSPLPDCEEYPVISHIMEGKLTEKGVHLRAGDRLVQINEQSLSWIPLKDVSRILLEMDTAVFHFEYDVNLIALCDDEKIRVKMEPLDNELGLHLDYCKKTQQIVIKSIVKGSLAERCGVFSEGDAIVEVNDIDSKLLTTSSANNLLRNFKKEPGRLIFLSLGGRSSSSEMSLQTDSEAIINLIPSHSSLNQKSIVIDSSHASLPTSVRTDYSDDYFGSSSNTCSPFSDISGKIIPVFRDVAQQISRFEFIPKFRIRSRVKKAVSDEVAIASTSQNDLTDFNSQLQSKLKGSISKKSPRKLSMRFSKKSSQTKHEDSSISTSNIPKSQEVHYNSIKINVVQDLIEKLEEIQRQKCISEQLLATMLSSIRKVRENCHECKEACFSAYVYTEKIYLLASLNIPNPDVLCNLNKLVEDLTALSIPCRNCRIYNYGKADLSFQDDFTCNDFYRMCKVSSISSDGKIPTSSGLDTNIITETRSDCSDDKVSDIGLNFEKENVIYTRSKTHKLDGNNIIDNVVDQDLSFDVKNDKTKNKILEASQIKNLSIAKQNVSIDEEFTAHSKVNVLDLNISKVTSNKKAIGISRKSNSSFSKSFHCFKPLKFTSSTSTDTKEPFNENTDMQSSSLTFTDTDIFSEFSSRKSSASDERSSTTFSPKRGNSTPSPYQKQLNSAVGFRGNVRKKSCILNVKLTDIGRSFGFTLGHLSPKSSIHQIPIISAIKPESPARKCGILALGDRVLAINGESVIGQHMRFVGDLKEKHFGKSEIVLTVEIDLEIHEMKSGNFEVCLDRTLKVGLLFEKIQESLPLVVEGVVKGSSAHRSGQIFAGDEILYSRCVREEAFDSLTYGYSRVDVVYFNVRRHRPKGSIKHSTPNALASGSQTHPSALVPSGTSFSVRRTTVRSIPGSNDVIVEQDLTLFRDPDYWDFGFSAGQDPVYGKAYITSLRPGGPAHQSRVIKKHDRILKVNGVLIDKKKDNSISNLLMEPKDHLHLVTRRILHHR